MAALYTFPLLRMPGDIDVWLHPAKISECSLSLVRKSVLELAGDKGKLEGVTYCHVHYPLLKDTEVELHFTPSWMNGFADNKRLQKFFMEQVPVQFSNEIELPDISENINSPTIEFNRFYILLHIYRHLFGEGIGLRQLMDYYHVLHHQASEDSIKRTLDILQQMGMTRFASAVMFVMQKVFGLKDNYLILPPDIKEGRFLLSEIMRSGNFGKFDKRIRRSSRMKYAPFVLLSHSKEIVHSSSIIRTKSLQMLHSESGCTSGENGTVGLILSKLLLSIKGQPLLKKSFCHSMKQIQLYDYQTEMKQRIESVFKLHRSAMVQMPTGTGKTYLLAAYVYDWVKRNESIVWIVAHRRELIQQIKDSVEQIMESMDEHISEIYLTK